MSKNLRGTHWGKLDLEENNVKFSDSEKQIFKIPFSKIQNSMINKQDITLELNTDDLAENEDMLSEIRFYLPPKQQEKKSDEEEEENEEQASKSQNEDQPENQEEEDDTQAYIKKLHQDIIQRAQIGKNAGESMCKFSDMQLMIPRGRYTVDFFKTSIRFHGQSYNYLIEYKHITRAFLLPMPDEVQVAFVIGLNKPIKQGNTIHPFIVIYFKKENECSIPLNITEEDKKKYSWDIDTTEPFEGYTNEVFASLFKQIIKVNIFIPGSFKSADGSKALNCNVKTNSGYFFPLQKSIIFINKPVIYIPHSEIVVIEFDRIGQGNKMFDVKIITKTTELGFVGFEKKELNCLRQYFQDRKVKVRGNEEFENFDEGGDTLMTAPRGEGKREIKRKNVDHLLQDDDDEEEDDSDFEGAGGSGDDEDDDDDFSDDDEESGMAKMVEESEDEGENKKKKKKEKKEEDDNDE